MLFMRFPRTCELPKIRIISFTEVYRDPIKNFLSDTVKSSLISVDRNGDSTLVLQSSKKRVLSPLLIDNRHHRPHNLRHPQNADNNDTPPRLE